jgi:Flp pilus assembly protein TadG
MRRLAAFARDAGGAAAVELALMASVLTLPLLNVPDLALYSYESMGVATAAHAGAQAAYSTCNASQYWPATANCPTLDTVVSDAVTNTTLGSKVALSGEPAEGYYCATTAGALVLVSTQVTTGSPKNVPATCSAATPPNGATWSDGAATPGDYVQVTVTFTYTPIFTSISILSYLNTTITKTQLIRLD